MTEEEKETIDNLTMKAITSSAEALNYPNCIVMKKDLITLLNLIQKQDTEINKLNNVIDNAIYIIKINNKNFENFTDENLKLWLYGFDKCALKEEDNLYENHN